MAVTILSQTAALLSSGGAQQIAFFGAGNGGGGKAVFCDRKASSLLSAVLRRKARIRFGSAVLRQKVERMLPKRVRGFIFLRGGGKCANISVSVQPDFRICRFARSRRVRDRVSVSVLGVTEV